MKAFYLLAAGLFLAAVSCERHEWEDTKILHEQHHEEHGDHGKGHEGHGHAEAEEGDHAGHDH